MKSKQILIERVCLCMPTYIQVGNDSRPETVLATPRFELMMVGDFIACISGRHTTYIPMSNVASIWLKDG